MVMTDLFVIMRSTGEYYDRDETPIRWVPTEEEAMAAVDRASIEAQRSELPPYPDIETAHGYRMPDGTFWDGPAMSSPSAAVFCRKPNGDELERQGEEARAAYKAACLALNHVDPDGCTTYATYSYERVSALPAPREPAP